MHRLFARRFLCLLALVMAVAASGSAVAQTTNYAVGATCSGGGQVCNSLATINVSTTGVLQVNFTASPSGCSSIRINYLVDSVPAQATGFLAPGASSGVINLGPVSSGAHVVGLQAEGQTGGCNSGTLGSWAGSAAVTVSSPAVAVPAPGLLAVGAALGLGALWFGPWRRRRS